MDPTLSKLTEKEEEVMALIWKLGSCAPKEVEDYGNRRISQFVDAFFSDSYMSVVSALVRDKKVDEADLLQFLADLRKQKVQGEQSTEAI